MLCSLCGKNESSVEFEGLINGKAVKFYLCETCMKSIDIESVLNRTHFSVEDFLSALSASMDRGRGENEESVRLKPILRKANTSQGNSTPRMTAVQENKLKEIEILKTEMAKAVKLEEYERAAVLRDKIKELESK